MPSIPDPAEVLPILQALADTTRLRIVSELARDQRSVGELATVLDVGQPTISHHLGQLKRVGVVESRAEGRRRSYALAVPPAGSLTAELLELLLGPGSSAARREAPRGRGAHPTQRLEDHLL